LDFLKFWKNPKRLCQQLGEWEYLKCVLNIRGILNISKEITDNFYGFPFSRKLFNVIACLHKDSKRQ